MLYHYMRQPPRITLKISTLHHGTRFFLFRLDFAGFISIFSNVSPKMAQRCYFASFQMIWYIPTVSFQQNMQNLRKIKIIVRDQIWYSQLLMMSSPSICYFNTKSINPIHHSSIIYNEFVFDILFWIKVPINLKLILY